MKKAPQLPIVETEGLDSLLSCFISLERSYLLRFLIAVRVDITIVDPSKSIQLFSIGFYHMLIPVKRFFTGTLQSTMAFVIHIHIDHAIALCHFTGARRNDVDASPGRITHYRHMIFFDGFLDGTDMTTQIVDAIIVLNGTIRIDRIRPAISGLKAL